MYGISYESLIKAIENNDTKGIIGSIDVDEISKSNIDTLFYEFPLIERIVLEIYKLLPLSDVEKYEQGKMRTIIRILENDSHNYFPDNLISILQKYYRDDGIRNRLFHVKDDIGTINLNLKNDDIEELKFVIMQLLSILRNTCGKFTIEKIGKIELLS